MWSDDAAVNCPLVCGVRILLLSHEVQRGPSWSWEYGRPLSIKQLDRAGSVWIMLDVFRGHEQFIKCHNLRDVHVRF